MNDIFDNNGDTAAVLQSQCDEWGELLRAEYEDQVEFVSKQVADKRCQIELKTASPGGLTQLLTNKPTALSTLFPNTEVFKKAHTMAVSIQTSIKQISANNIICDSYLGLGLYDGIPVFLRKCTLTPTRGHKDFMITLDSYVQPHPEIARLFGGSPKKIKLNNGQMFDETSAIKTINAQLADDEEKATFTQFITVLPDLNGDFSTYYEEIIEDVKTSELIETLVGSKQEQEQSATQPVRLAQADMSPPTEIGLGDLSLQERSLVSYYSKGESFLVSAPFSNRNAKLTAAFLAQSNCQNEQVLHISGAPRVARNVKRELKKYGLESLYLDAFPRPRHYEALEKQVRKAHGQPGNQAFNVDLSISERLEEVRQEFAEALDVVHQKKKPWNVSYYDVISNVRRYNNQVKCDLRFTRDTTINVKDKLASFVPDLERIIELNTQSSDSGAGADASASAASSTTASIWSDAMIDTPQAAAAIAEKIDRLLDMSLPTVQQYMQEIASVTKLKTPQNVTEWVELSGLLLGMRSILDSFTNEVFSRDIDIFIQVMAPDQRTTAESAVTGKKMSFLERSRLIKEAKSLLRPGQKVADLYSALVKVRKYKRKWIELQQKTSDIPEVLAAKFVVDLPKSTIHAASITNALLSDINAINEVFQTSQTFPNLKKLSFVELLQTLTLLSTNKDILARLPERTALIRSLESKGLGEFAVLVSKNGVPKSQLLSTLEHIWWESVRAQMVTAHSVYTEITAQKFQQLTSEFLELDAQHVKMLDIPVKFILQQHLQEAKEAFPTLTEHNYLDFAKQYYTAFATSWNNVNTILDADEVVDTLIIDAPGDIPFGCLIPALAKAKRVVIFMDAPTRSADNDIFATFAAVLPVFELPVPPSLRDVRLTYFLQNLGDNNVVPDNLRLPKNPAPNAPNGMGVVKFEHTKPVAEFAQNFIIDYCQRKAGTLNVATLTSELAEQIKQGLRKRMASDPELGKKMVDFESTSGNFIDISSISANHFMSADDVLLCIPPTKIKDDHLTTSASAELTQTCDYDGLVSVIASTHRNLQVVSSIPEAYLNGGSNANQNADEVSKGEQLLHDFLKFANKLSDSPINDEIAAGNFELPTKRATANSIVKYLAQVLEEKGYTVGIDYNFSTDATLKIPLAVYNKDKSKAVAVIVDDFIYYSVKSIRVKVRHRIELLQQFGWIPVMVWSAGFVENPNLAVAKITDAFVDDYLKVPAKARTARGGVPTGSPAHPRNGNHGVRTNTTAHPHPHLTARDKEMLANKPPHWG
jgi:hypothetical protein